jgi:uncharacterized SAM-dependent methyltransferase
MNLEDLKKNARQFLALKTEMSMLADRQSELKSRMTQEIDTLEPDDKGHRIIAFEDATLGNIKVTKQRKVSKTLDMEVAEKILTEKGIKNTCIKMVPVLDEAAIMAAFYEGYLTESDIDTMFPAKETFAFIVDNK